jgi:hypothetical protein
MAWCSGEAIRKNQKRFFHGRADENYPTEPYAQAAGPLLYPLGSWNYARI